MARHDGPVVSIMWDIFWSLVVAIIIIGVWTSIYLSFGDPSKINTGIVTFIGGVLVISGLLFKQYMIKEVLEYLKAWGRMKMLLDVIIQKAITSKYKEDDHIKDLSSQKAQAENYECYVRRELAIIPFIPVVLVFLYGCALLSENLLPLRVTCLFLMILCLTYLSITAITSNRIACAYPHLEDTLSELEKLRSEIERKVL